MPLNSCKNMINKKLNCRILLSQKSLYSIIYQEFFWVFSDGGGGTRKIL